MGRFGHEFLEFELSGGKLRYANNSNYKNDSLIKKQVNVNPLLVGQVKRMIEESEIVR